ncbi:MAG: type II secretion system protein [Oceanipulchritudo sp.]
MKSRRNGFTLIEIMVVVVIIGLLATLAIPAFKKARMSSRYVKFMNDARVLAGAVDTLYLASGVKPVDSATGNIDPALAEYVREGFFVEETPLGGQWDVEADDSGIGLGVGVVNFNISSGDLAALDAKYDDGSLDAGRFRLITGSRYYWVLED